MADIDEIEREIKALAVEYLSELPERFERLLREVEELKLGRGNALEAQREAHKIKGTASSYGAHEIGAQTVIIDDCLKQICKKGSSVAPEIWQKLDRALAEASRLSAAAADEAGAGRL